MLFLKGEQASADFRVTLLSLLQPSKPKKLNAVVTLPRTYLSNLNQILSIQKVCPRSGVPRQNHGRWGGPSTVIFRISLGRFGCCWGRTPNEQRLSGTEVVIVDCLIFSTINERAGELAQWIEVAHCCEGKAEANLPPCFPATDFFSNLEVITAVRCSRQCYF